MYRCPELPFLPGYSFNADIGRTQFPRSQIFAHFGDVRMLTDKLQPGKPGKIHDRYPSIYCKGEVSELPGWIAFDKQVLTFDLFFQETLQEVRKSPFQIRKCKLYFFLEDGTIKVVEPKVENSGIPQGTLISRQRIRFPPPKDDLFFDIVDFNVGREVELYGKVFKITNCDQFTRNFLNRLGIPVPDPINTPSDPYQVNRLETLTAIFPKKPNRHVDTFGQFLKYDRQVLRFYGYWDDRDTLGGYLHDLMIHYYLADDTIEIIENMRENCGHDTTSKFIRKGKLPKFFDALPEPGSNSDMVVLNVLGANVQEGRYVVDPLRAGMQNVQYFRENDLAIGAAISVYGRKVVLTDCDPFTKEYYRVKYGLDDLSPTKRPPQEPVVESVPLHQRKLPPWNGYGTFEDSAQNCITVEPKQIMRDFKKFLTLDREGMDSKILRFRAYMRSQIPDNCRRIFVISYFLCDNTISVYEMADKSPGASFMTRGALKLPGQEVFTSEPPDYYEPQHMFIGASVNFNGFHFLLTDADEYALRYMELHANEFPKSNINIIIDKVRGKIKPIYKDFVAENMPKEQPVLPFITLRQKLCAIMGDDWSEQEMITLARHFSAICRTQRHDRKFIRQLVLTELKRLLWDDLERFKEYFIEYDFNKTGFLPIKKVYTLIRACKLPLDVTLIENMIEVLAKNDKCEVDGQDLICFLDRNHCPLADTVPINIKNELWFASEPEPVAGKLIDWCAFIKALNLEEEFQKPIVVPKKEDDFKG